MANSKGLSSKFRILGKDLLLYGVMGGVSKVIGFILLPIFVRVFSTDEYGIVDTISIFTSLLAMSMSLALPSALNRFFYDDRIEKNNDFFSTLLFFVSGISILGFILLVLFSDEVSELLLGSSEYSIYIVLAGITAIFQSMHRLSEALIRLRKKIIQYNLINIGQTLMFVALSLSGVFLFEMGVLAIFYAMLFSYIATFFIGLIMNRSYLTLKFDLKLLKQSMSHSFPMFPAVFVTWANSQLDRLVLLTFVGLSGVGIFGAGYRISNVTMLFTKIFRKAWNPFAMEILSDSDSDQVYIKALTFYTCFFALLSLSIVFFSKEVLYLIVTPDYYESIFVIPWLIGATVVHGALNMINIGTIITGKTFANSVAAWSGFFANLILTIFLVQLYGIQGAAIGTFTAELINAIILWNRSNYLTEIRFETGKIIKVLLIYIIASVGILFSVESNLLDLYLVLIKAALLIILGWIIVKICFSKDELSGIKKKILKLK